MLYTHTPPYKDYVLEHSSSTNLQRVSTKVEGRLYCCGVGASGTLSADPDPDPAAAEVEDPVEELSARDTPRGGLPQQSQAAPMPAKGLMAPPGRRRFFPCAVLLLLLDAACADACAAAAALSACSLAAAACSTVRHVRGQMAA